MQRGLIFCSLVFIIKLYHVPYVLKSCTLYLSASDVFKLLNSKYKKLDLMVGASFFEIYSGKVIIHDIY